MTHFSIIIPVYNVEAYLRQCLDSVLGQTYGDFEAMCVNDGSTDGSLAILEEYAARDSRIRIISQPNRGLSAARNAGLLKATGEYILFLDSDDWLEQNALEVLSTNLASEDMLCFGGRRYDETNGSYRLADTLPCTTYATGMDYYDANALAPRDFAFVCVVLRCYRRQFLIENQLNFKEGILHEDNLFTPQACLHAHTVKVIDNILYNYRIRKGSIMTSRNLKSRKDMLLIANELTGIFTQYNDLDRSVIYRATTHHYQAAFARASRDDDRQLLPLIDWHLYHTVSRTRLRHRLNFCLLRISPALFRMINKTKH